MRALRTATDTPAPVDCARCGAPYRAALVDGCPVCGNDAVGYDPESADVRMLTIVVAVTALNLLLLAGLVVVVT